MRGVLESKSHQQIDGCLAARHHSNAPFTFTPGSMKTRAILLPVSDWVKSLS